MSTQGNPTPQNEPAVFGHRPNQPISWYAANLHRSNQYCLYCGAVVGLGSTVRSNREHLLARNFVPAGTLDDTAFNFIFRACVGCNSRKADAERHVSSVTLFTSAARGDDPRAESAAVRKGENDFDPKLMGTRIKDATVERGIEGRFGAAHLTFSLVGPPQLSHEAVALLACNQIQALFALVTTSDPRERGSTSLLPAKNWRLFGSFPFNDWGNPQLAKMVERVAEWPIVLRIETADGYFKALMRDRGSREEWFWALEWNKSLRVVGAIYHPDKTPQLFDDLPSLDWTYLPGNTRMRKEVPLAPEHDRLFAD